MTASEPKVTFKRDGRVLVEGVEVGTMTAWRERRRGRSKPVYTYDWRAFDASDEPFDDRRCSASQRHLLVRHIRAAYHRMQSTTEKQGR